MNSISWLIYLIYVLGNLQGALTMIATIVGIGLVCAFVYYAISIDNAGSPYRSEERSIEELRKLRNKCFKSLLIGIPLAILVIATIPDRRTMIMIASSQVGEKVFTSEKLTSVIDPSVDLLKTWIENELTDQKKKLSEKTAK